MFNQHAKWLKVTSHLPWRRKIASLNHLLASHVWRQDHNGFTHQDPGFIDKVVNKKAEVVRVYLPPDANCLLFSLFAYTHNGNLRAAASFLNTCGALARLTLHVVTAPIAD
jgi:phosphoketolase